MDRRTRGQAGTGTSPAGPPPAAPLTPGTEKGNDVERLAGRVALITGAASGIGKATAERFAAEGAAVMIADVNDEGGKALADELGYRGRAAYQHLDVASEQEWQRVITGTVEQFGGLDILVNNAGVHGEPAPLEETSLADWDRSIAIMQTGAFLGMKHAAPALLRSGHASVVNISSIYGASGGFGTSPAYHAAKGAVRVLTKTAALHWAQQGIRVNSVHPGFIDTPLLDPVLGPERTASSEIYQALLSVTPLGRLGRPEEVAAGVAYLASDDATFVTGSELYIDGGYMAR
jgi:NAD(P)-dependent dehydrogenase (short-subunit alcohol dehydrogenase family)